MPSQTYTLADGRSIESEMERKGSKIRVRLRVCYGDFITAAYSATLGLKERIRWDALPREFLCDPKIRVATFDAAEEIWRLRLQIS